MLLALYAEKNSRAVALLEGQGVTSLDAANYISHGVGKVPQPTRNPQRPKHKPVAQISELADGASDLQVVLYNDDVTPMEFVVRVLQDFFDMNREEATEAMLEIHRGGVAVCGLYSKEAAEQLVEEVLAYALEQGYPLRCATLIPK